MHQRHEKTLLIHGFSPVNARLLTVYGTASYAIIFDKTRLKTEGGKAASRSNRLLLVMSLVVS